MSLALTDLSVFIAAGDRNVGLADASTVDDPFASLARDAAFGGVEVDPNENSDFGGGTEVEAALISVTAGGGEAGLLSDGDDLVLVPKENKPLLIGAAAVVGFCGTAAVGFTSTVFSAIGLGVDDDGALLLKPKENNPVLTGAELVDFGVVEGADFVDDSLGVDEIVLADELFGLALTDELPPNNDPNTPLEEGDGEDLLVATATRAGLGFAATAAGAFGTTTGRSSFDGSETCGNGIVGKVTFGNGGSLIGSVLTGTFC